MLEPLSIQERNQISPSELLMRDKSCKNREPWEQLAEAFGSNAHENSHMQELRDIQTYQDRHARHMRFINLDLLDSDDFSIFIHLPFPSPNESRANRSKDYRPSQRSIRLGRSPEWIRLAQSAKQFKTS